MIYYYLTPHVNFFILSGDAGSASFAILKADIQLDYTNHGRSTAFHFLKKP